MFLDLARNFRNIRTPKHQEAICLLTRILANVEKASQIGEGWDIVPELSRPPDLAPTRHEIAPDCLPAVPFPVERA